MVEFWYYFNAVASEIWRATKYIFWTTWIAGHNSQDMHIDTVDMKWNSRSNVVTPARSTFIMTVKFWSRIAWLYSMYLLFQGVLSPAKTYARRTPKTKTKYTYEDRWHDSWIWILYIPFRMNCPFRISNEQTPDMHYVTTSVFCIIFTS